MPPFTAPALLIGLGARLILDFITRSEESTTRDFILLGVWQGVALQYAYKDSAFAIPLAFGVGIKLLLEFIYTHDSTRCATTIIGAFLGFTCTDFLAQYIDTQPAPDRRRRRAQTPTPAPPTAQRQRLVQFRRSVHGDTTEDTHEQNRQSFRHTVSDITSVDSTSELIGPNPSMTPLEREVAALRARASLADTERRRYKEERKWALSQGNTARASQMKWQVKRYTALMQSFHREADAKLIEASRARPQTSEQLPQQQPVPRERLRTSREENGTTYTATTIDTRGHQRTRSGTLKSAMRESVR